MPALIAAGSAGQASTTAANSGSLSFRVGLSAQRDCQLQELAQGVHGFR
jgi:hypothetical protein